MSAFHGCRFAGGTKTSAAGFDERDHDLRHGTPRRVSTNSRPRPMRCRSYHKAASASPTEASVSARRRSISASSEVERCDCGHPPKIPRQTHRIKRIIVCFAGYFPTRSIPVCGRNDAAPHGLRWRTGVARRLRAHSKVFQDAAILEWLTCCLYVTIMVIKGAALKTANISELKSRLSSYLADVQRGEEIIVRDRNRPRALFRRFKRPVVWWATQIEIRSALAPAAGRGPHRSSGSRRH